MSGPPLRYFCDNARHLVCVPYSVENLHRMARDLGIARAWFDANPAHPHYDIPKRRIAEVTGRCTLVPTIIKEGLVPEGREQRSRLEEDGREVLNEDDTGAIYSDLRGMDMSSPWHGMGHHGSHGGGYGFGGMGGMGPYGARFGSGNDLYRVFVKPLVDVVDTAVGKTKELSSRALTLAHVAFETLVTTLVPFFSDSYKEIFAAEKKRLGNIRNEYKEVYQSNWDAFRDNDVFWTAFCYAPWAIMTIKFFKQSPHTTGRLVSALTGGAADRVLGRMLGDWNRAYRPPITGLNYTGTSSGMGADTGIHVEGTVLEDDEGKKKKGAQDLAKAARVLTSPKFIDLLKKSPVAQGLAQEAQAAVRESLTSVYKEAQAVLTSRSVHELQQKSGKKIPAAQGLEKVPADQRKALEEGALAGFREAMKKMYVDGLESRVKQAVQGGVPEDSPFVVDHRSVIAKIKAL